MAEPSPSPHPWPVHRTFYIPYHDVDVLNHLNHAAYFPYMETLRCDYYLPLLSSTDPASIDIIIAEATARYLAPVPYGASLFGEVAPARPLGRTSFSLLYRFTLLPTPTSTPTTTPHPPLTPTLTARGRTVIVMFDYHSGTKKEIPPHLRVALERDAVDPAEEGW
ncbi:MAG: thioesterase family protein [Thermoplasmata archaeon]|nr:thioesterase family protein [Thermoplasmata archaeon]